ncbi:hypothetical protein A2U01_0066445, partial [Trifolium medium]|nr:hypothetical protein [Trifolium medium]
CFCAPRRGSGASRQNRGRKLDFFWQLRVAQEGWHVAPAKEKESWELLSSARRAGEDGASRQSVGSLHQEGSSVARRTASTGASRTDVYFASARTIVKY